MHTCILTLRETEKNNYQTLQTNTGRKKIVASFLTQTHENVTEKYRKNETNNELIKY